MTKRVSVVCFKYNVPGYRTRFTSSMVNKLFLMLARNVGPDVPFELVCITDDPKGLMSDIMVRKMLPTFRSLRNPTSHTRPNCYPRLPLFDPSNPYGLQEYWLSIDLDAVITGDVTRFIQHGQDFRVWKIRGHYCGSLFGGRIGATPQLFTEFDPVQSPKLTNDAGLRGSDQAWFEYKLGPDMPTWTVEDGVYGWQDEIGVKARRRRVQPIRRSVPIQLHGRRLGTLIVPRSAPKPTPPEPVREAAPVRPHGVGNLPPNAKMVFFYGEPKAWDRVALEQSPWIAEHYR